VGSSHDTACIDHRVREGRGSGTWPQITPGPGLVDSRSIFWGHSGPSTAEPCRIRALAHEDGFPFAERFLGHILGICIGLVAFYTFMIPLLRYPDGFALEEACGAACGLTGLAANDTRH
jgi:hypothetical protein